MRESRAGAELDQPATAFTASLFHLALDYGEDLDLCSAGGQFSMRSRYRFECDCVCAPDRIELFRTLLNSKRGEYIACVYKFHFRSGVSELPVSRKICRGFHSHSRCIHLFEKPRYQSIRVFRLLPRLHAIKSA